ncbi:hypothetical protein ACI3PL_20910, partial [Lacticaseibacillus paracasei]
GASAAPDTWELVSRYVSTPARGPLSESVTLGAAETAEQQQPQVPARGSSEPDATVVPTEEGGESDSSSTARGDGDAEEDEEEEEDGKHEAD